jgi:ElaB/YqjD/DUF883 family membrane-anchored ribosome-binding protein
MDQRAHDVEEDLKNILQTRLALADKVQALERRVEETVETTKSAALDALDLARNRAADFIESTTHHLNPSIQAGRRPWIMIGSAIAVGFFAGLIEHRRRSSGVYRYYPPDADGADVEPEKSRADLPSGVYPFYGREAPRAETRPRRRQMADGDQGSETRLSELWKPLRSFWDEVTDELAQERSRLINTAFHTGRSFMQDIIRIAGQSLLDQLSRPGGTAAYRSGQRRTRYE